MRYTLTEILPAVIGGILGALIVFGILMPRMHVKNEAWLASWLDVYTHKLAEQQRAWLRSQGYDTDCICETCAACLARDHIDLIDPRAHP